MEHLACKATEVLDPGPGLNFDSEFQQEILAWNELHVVIRTHSQGFCGIGNSWREDVVSTYRVNTGAQVDMRAWLRSEYQQSIAEDSALHRLLLRAYASSSVADMEACKNQIGWTSKDLYGLPGAVVFAAPTLSPLSAACTADVTVPLSQIQPFLSPEGKRAMQAYR